MSIDDRVLVLMPTEKDGERTRKALSDAGLECKVCKNLTSLCLELKQGAGVALLTEEAVVGDRKELLQHVLSHQPPWSDFPLVVIAREGSEGAELRESMNATLIERPIRIRSLLSVVRAALRSRRYQYAIRDHMAGREQQADALRKSEERLKRMVSVNGVGVLVFQSPEGRLINANDFFLNMFGYTRAEMEAGALTWRTMTPPEYVEVSLQQLDEFEVTGQIGPYEKEYLHKDGSRTWMVFAGAALGDGTIVEYCIDIGDRKRAEQALLDADRKKDDFIALLAHELRNPLAPIRNGLQVMHLAANDAITVAQVRRMMDRQLAHMVRLIDDLLDVSRISRNKMQLRIERVLLADVVDSAVETARPQIDSAGHKLLVSLPPEPIYLDADLTRLAQVVSNLLTNSAKYTEQGGRIQLEAKRAATELILTVRDSGIGIPEESLSSIFDMFSQVERSIERSTGGLGIGLALVKGLIEMHGGRVTAESPGLGAGSTFTIRLPMSELGPPPKENVSQNETHEPGRRVLVVDDNNDSANSMAMMLRLLGDEVRTAHDGFAALKAAEEFLPHVILMDVGMPQLNGLDATRRIRQRPWGRQIKIIALTGWGQEGDREQTRAAGCDGHVVKPVQLPELERVLGDSGPGAESSDVMNVMTYHKNHQEVEKSQECVTPNELNEC